jgi:exodeoxyribonuclease VII small subunit
MTEINSSLSDLSYEQAFSELESIVEALESEQKPLDESLALYERGQLLVQYCMALLEQADLRIRQLNPNEGEEGA